ncbi:MAG: hypothetical protein QXT01_06270 [Sulfolobales archaeon]
MSVRHILYVSTILTLLLLPQVLFAQPQEGLKITDLVEEVLKNPRTLVAVVIQFLMGLGLGYFSLKALKYILALIVILVLGTALSIWSIGTSPESFLIGIYEYFKYLQPHLITLLQLLGLMTIGPVTLGFIVGALIAIIRK